jgi:type VI secretion system Hcp family effector
MSSHPFFSLLLSGAMLLGTNPGSTPQKPFAGNEIIGTMKVEGAKQGVISGTGRGTASSWMNLTGFTMGSAIVVTKKTDPASPKIFQAFSTNETLKTVILQLLKKTADGRQVHDRIITLTNVVISKIRRDGQDVNPKTSASAAAQTEEISFKYQKIEIKNVAASTSTADDWNTPNQ